MFALLSPICFAIVNLFETRLRHHHIKNDYVLGAFFASLFFISFLLVPFVGFSIPPIPILILCLLAGMLYIYCLVPYFKALAVEETSRVIALWFTVPALLPLFAFLFFGELLTIPQYIGFFLVVIGGVIISLRKTTDHKRVVSKAIWLVFLSGMIFNGTCFSSPKEPTKIAGFVYARAARSVGSISRSHN